jgi:formate dehydrogenase assembly factor FdhD
MTALDNVRALQAEVEQLKHERDSWAALAAAHHADLRKSCSENLKLRNDIARHVAIAAEQAGEIEELRALLREAIED